MDDLISRQAAIDAMEQAKEQYFDRRVIIGKMQDVVNNLPSAQPEDGEMCDQCRHNPNTDLEDYWECAEHLHPKKEADHV